MSAPAAVEFDREAAARELLPRALRVANRYAARVGRSHRLDDYESAAILGVALAIDSYKPGSGTLKRWVYRLVVQECYRVRRGEVRRFHLGNEVEVDELTWAFLGIDDDARDEFERDADVADAMGKLEPRDRRLLKLLYWQGLTNIEAGKRMKMCPWSVIQRKHRIHSQLREQLS